ncbi:hypothetical protein ES703_112831 [subsurface metagenome]
MITRMGKGAGFTSPKTPETTPAEGIVNVNLIGGIYRGRVKAN